MLTPERQQKRRRFLKLDERNHTGKLRTLKELIGDTHEMNDLISWFYTHPDEVEPLIDAVYLMPEYRGLDKHQCPLCAFETVHPRSLVYHWLDCSYTADRQEEEEEEEEEEGDHK